MKKLLTLFVMMSCANVYSIAQNKRIACMEIEGSRPYSATFYYDDQDRVSQIQYTEDGKKHTVNYTYDGDEKISISLSHNSGSDTYIYNLSNGKVQSGTIYLDADNVTQDYSFTYECDNLIKIGIVQKTSRKTKEMSYEYTWNEGNPTNVISYYQGELDMENTSIFNSITTHPLIHVIFGLCPQVSPDFDEMIPYFVLYKLFGTIPQSLMASCEEKDYYENRNRIYELIYEIDSDGMVNKVVVSSAGKTKTYKFTWEDAKTTSMYSFCPKQHQPSALYNLKGQQVTNADAKGLVIVRYPDGSVKKECR